MKSTIELLSVENEEFIRSLMDCCKYIYITKSGSLKTNYNKLELYHKNILEVCLSIHSTFDTLFLCRTLTDDSLKSLNCIENRDKVKLLRYHIEYFFIKITSFKDLTFKLINKVYNFGFNENIGLEKKIRKELKKRYPSELDDILLGIDIVMKGIVTTRNKITHGGYLVDAELILIESFGVSNHDNVLKEITKRYNYNIISFMFHNELMLTTNLILMYKKLIHRRKCVEKEITSKS